ncbi:MAG: HAMP domain-containing histidine kinase [Oscillospiraceae bacterium]|nr:HAMP domain-containing histidine kinase [Oscillospiraceae bacterium]
MKYSSRMRLYYWLIISVVVFFSFVAVALALFFLDGMSGMPHLSLVAFFTILVVFTITVGITAYYVGRRIMAPMVKLSEASRQVAHRNFNVSVSDSSRLEEVQTTFRNFNAMVRELQRIDTLSADFIASVSHEFKTPLTAIEGYAMLLQTPGLAQSEHDEYLDKILTNTHRLSTLVGNILTLSKLETQSLAEQQSVFRLDEQIRQAIVALEPLWAEKEIEFEVELDAVSLRGCETILSLIWSNLISNAIKFSPPGGTVTISLQDQTECAVAQVRDHGCGMTAEVQERIFEKFYQGDPSHKAQGHGLGLALVKRIVELSDGVVEVESAPGAGACFRVILPKA